MRALDSHSSSAILWNRQCLPTFWQGILPCWASLYTDARGIRRYTATSSTVMTGGCFVLIGSLSRVRPPRRRGLKPPSAQHCSLLSIVSGWSMGPRSGADPLAIPLLPWRACLREGQIRPRLGGPPQGSSCTDPPAQTGATSCWSYGSMLLHRG